MLFVCRAYKAKAAGLDYTRLGSMAQQVRYCCKENCNQPPNHRATKRINEINEQTMVMEGHVEGMIVHETVTIEKREAEYNYESGFLMLT